MADEIRNNSQFNLKKSISYDFYGGYAGFAPFADNKEHGIIVETVRGRLTQSLNLITEELAQETSKAVETLYGQPHAWTEIQYEDLLLSLVARVPAHVFIGPELSANQDWLDVSVNYVTQAFIATEALNRWHFSLRPVVHWFLPECRKLRSNFARAHRILTPVVKKRRDENVQARQTGSKLSKVADTIGWMDEAAKGANYDIASSQLGLAIAAIHTTTQLVSGIITDLCSHPEWLDPLRGEMASAIKAHGWTKKALHEMKLTDSMMKESQRHHFGDFAAMHRVVTSPVTLADGTAVPKGALTMVGLEKMEDPELLADPIGYHPRRFLDMRQQPGQENKWQFVTTSPEHLAFGHGKHACPGRFFAANEAKVILVYLLAKFDWKWPADGSKEGKEGEGVGAASPSAKVLIRLREQDILL